MATNSKREFFVETTSGTIFKISELDFNNINGRISRGQTNAWYTQRGETVGDRANWSLQFKYISAVYANKEKPMDKPVRDLDIEKRLPPKVGKVEEAPKGCSHDWNKPETYEFVTQIVNGLNRYHKMCKECGAKSNLIKTREVELAMEAEGKTLDDVRFLE